MLTKLCDLRWRQRRNRPPYLVGNAAGFDLLIVGRYSPPPGEPDFTMFVGRVPTTTGSKPLPPVWDDAAKRWIGPASPDYGEFYDDIPRLASTARSRCAGCSGTRCGHAGCGACA
jgi:hypothetical protein